jgi:hypothetical protein
MSNGSKRDTAFCQWALWLFACDKLKLVSFTVFLFVYPKRGDIKSTVMRRDREFGKNVIMIEDREVIKRKQLQRPST